MSLTNEALMEHLISGRDLEEPLVRELMERILSGSMPPAQIAASLALLRAKGESPVEIAEAALVVMGKANPIEPPDFPFADVVGTGGDGHHTINVSTLASLTAASLGVPVAKHGNSSVSSQCGSADLLQALGVNINMTPQESRSCLEKHQWCFLFAPLYHPAFKSMKPIRQELRIKTIFNILGPLVNPLKPSIMLVGVYDPRLLEPFALALKNLGRTRVMVVHGSGLDEIALHGPTTAILVDDGSVKKLSLTPKDLGLLSFSLKDVVGALPQENAELGRRILSGDGDDAKTSLIAASAGVLLWLFEKAATFSEGVKLSRDALKSGVPIKTLEHIKRFADGT
jgi:anthranilate phosphoribosyltransferase